MTYQVGRQKKLREEIHARIEVMWESQKMPENWRTAIICPIHKEGNKTAM